MVERKGGSIPPGVPEIMLVRDLDLNQLIEKSRDGLANGIKGSTINFRYKKGEAKSISFVENNGFWINEGRKGGHKLVNSAVILGSADAPVIFVQPGGHKDEVTGIKINHKRQAEKFSYPLDDNCPEVIKDAKKLACDNCKPKT
jgi:hypothetical protein